MTNYVELPPEFERLEGRVNFVHRVNDNEYHSSCPNCGGEMHPDGSPPDRFVMWVVSRTGTPFGMCLRGHCNFKWSPLKEDATWTPEEREAARQKRAEIEARREAKIAEIAERVMQQGYFARCWKEAQNDQAALDYWTGTRAIPQEWFDHLRLGVWKDYRVTGRLSTYHSDAYTIPVWTYGVKAENIKLRVAEPHNDNDRYRNIYKSGAQHLFTPDFDRPGVDNISVVMEGEIKSITGRIYGGLPDAIGVQGWQSKQPDMRIYRFYERAELIYLALDYDAYLPDKNGNVSANAITKRLGAERVRYVIPPKGCKFDDIILQGFNFRNAVNMAIKPQNWKYWS